MKAGESMKRKRLACMGLGALFGIFCYWQNYGITTTSMTYHGQVPKAFDGCKIVQVADLQNTEFGRDNARLVRKIEASSPDIIVITGDLLDRNRTNVESAMDFIYEIKQLAPVYFVTGNHEHQSGEWEVLEESLVNAGVTILNNGKSVLEKDGDTITLMGLADKKVNPSYDTILHTLMTEQQDCFNILLSHRPELFETYVNAGVDLVFTGHAHGGQIRIPFTGQGIFAPHQGFFPKYTQGMHEKDGTVMIVSRGLGNSIFPLRLFNRPELIEVTLRAERE